MNEVDHVESPHTPAEVAAAVRAFADGVKSADPTLLVATPSLGGTPMDVDRADRFLAALGPLLEDGTLDVLNLHSYHDTRPRKPHYSSLDPGPAWVPTRNFLRAKKAAGLTRPVTHAAGEFNYRNWDGTDDDRARGFMTALWDQLMVVQNPGGPRCGLFSLPYELTDARPAPRQTVMAEAWAWRDDGTYDWAPNEKGRVLRDQVAATRGMRFVACDPHGAGVAVLRGAGKTAWAWHNRPGYSPAAGADAVTVTGVPPATTQLKVVTATTTAADPARTVPTGGRAEVVITAPPAGQTLLILADGEAADLPPGTVGRAAGT